MISSARSQLGQRDVACLPAGPPHRSCALAGHRSPAHTSVNLTAVQAFALSGWPGQQQVAEPSTARLGYSQYSPSAESLKAARREACQLLGLSSPDELQDYLAALVLSECVYKKLEKSPQALAVTVSEFASQFPAGWVSLEFIQLSLGDIPQHYLMAVGDDALYVAFMGTKQARDLVTDASIAHEAVWAEAAELAVDKQAIPAAHRGFLERSRSIPVEMLYDLALSQKRRLVLCGHSLGGAVAKLCALRLLRDLPQWPLPSLSCVCFATPAVGNSALAELVESAGWATRIKTYFLPEDQLMRLLSLTQPKPLLPAPIGTAQTAVATATSEPVMAPSAAAAAAAATAVAPAKASSSGRAAAGTAMLATPAPEVLQPSPSEIYASSEGLLPVRVKSNDAGGTGGSSASTSWADGAVAAQDGTTDAALPSPSAAAAAATSRPVDAAARCEGVALLHRAPGCVAMTATLVGSAAAHLLSATPMSMAAADGSISSSSADLTRMSVEEEEAMEEILSVPPVHGLSSLKQQQQRLRSGEPAVFPPPSAALESMPEQCTSSSTTTQPDGKVERRAGRGARRLGGDAAAGAQRGGRPTRMLNLGLMFALQRKRAQRQIRRLADAVHLPLPAPTVAPFTSFGTTHFIYGPDAVASAAAGVPTFSSSRNGGGSSSSSSGNKDQWSSMSGSSAAARDVMEVPLLPPGGLRGPFSHHRMLAYRYRTLELIGRAMAKSCRVGAQAAAPQRPTVRSAAVAAVAATVNAVLDPAAFSSTCPVVSVSDCLFPKMAVSCATARLPMRRAASLSATASALAQERSAGARSTSPVSQTASSSAIATPALSHTGLESALAPETPAVADSKAPRRLQAGLGASTSSAGSSAVAAEDTGGGATAMWSAVQPQALAAAPAWVSVVRWLTGFTAGGSRSRGRDARKRSGRDVAGGRDTTESVLIHVEGHNLEHARLVSARLEDGTPLAVQVLQIFNDPGAALMGVGYSTLAVRNSWQDTLLAGSRTASSSSMGGLVPSGPLTMMRYAVESVSGGVAGRLGRIMGAAAAAVLGTPGNSSPFAMGPGGTQKGSSHMVLSVQLPTWVLDQPQAASQAVAAGQSSPVQLSVHLKSDFQELGCSVVLQPVRVAVIGTTAYAASLAYAALISQPPPASLEGAAGGANGQAATASATAPMGPRWWSRLIGGAAPHLGLRAAPTSGTASPSPPSASCQHLHPGSGRSSVKAARQPLASTLSQQGAPGVGNSSSEQQAGSSASSGGFRPLATIRRSLLHVLTRGAGALVPPLALPSDVVQGGVHYHNLLSKTPSSTSSSGQQTGSSSGRSFPLAAVAWSSRTVSLGAPEFARLSPWAALRRLSLSLRGQDLRRGWWVGLLRLVPRPGGALVALLQLVGGGAPAGVLQQIVRGRRGVASQDAGTGIALPDAAAAASGPPPEWHGAIVAACATDDLRLLRSRDIGLLGLRAQRAGVPLVPVLLTWRDAPPAAAAAAAAALAHACRVAPEAVHVVLVGQALAGDTAISRPNGSSSGSSSSSSTVSTVAATSEVGAAGEAFADGHGDGSSGRSTIGSAAGGATARSPAPPASVVLAQLWEAPGVQELIGAVHVKLSQQQPLERIRGMLAASKP